MERYEDKLKQINILMQKDAKVKAKSLKYKVDNGYLTKNEAIDQYIDYLKKQYGVDVIHREMPYKKGA
tara:strand:- start:1590 stop:1793 length:204 start_codon:yes stop_codon:yes gene_type:complete